MTNNKKNTSGGNKRIKNYYDKLSRTIKDPTETRNKARDFSKYDVAFVNKVASNKKTLLDLGAGTGLLLNDIMDNFERVVAVELYPEFSRFIQKRNHVEIVNEDIINFTTDETFDVVTLFGVMNYFNKNEALTIYQKIFSFLNKGGIVIVKNQMGVKNDVIVDGLSDELGTRYYSEYRSLENEKKLLKKTGFSIVSVTDIYPEKYNRWSNTHFYAVVAKRI